MLILNVVWGLLLFTVIKPCEILVAGAAIRPLSAWVKSIVAPIKISARNTPNSTGWGSNSQVIKRDGRLPTALVDVFQSSSWIWTAETDAPNAPALDRAFRNTLISPLGKAATSALVLLSVDDRFSFYVNGNLIGTSPTTLDNWKNAHIYNVTLAATANVFAIRGVNLPDVNGGGPTPAGVLAAIQITFSDGSTSLVSSSGGWRATKDIPNNFESPTFDDSEWAQASALFKYGEGPWRTDVVLPADVPPVTTSPASTSPVSTSPTSTKQTTAAPTATNSGASHGSQPVGAIIGGVVGGIVFLFLVVLAFLWRKRRLHRMRGASTLLPQTDRFELGHTTPSQHSFQVEMTQPHITTPRNFHHVSSPSASSAYLSTVTPSMSASRADQGSDGTEFRDRIERLEGLVLELDREIASGGAGSRVAESTHQNRDPFAGGAPHDGKAHNMPPPAYETNWD